MLNPQIVMRIAKELQGLLKKPEEGIRVSGLNIPTHWFSSCLIINYQDWEVLMNVLTRILNKLDGLMALGIQISQTTASYTGISK